MPLAERARVCYTHNCFLTLQKVQINFVKKNVKIIFNNDYSLAHFFHVETKVLNQAAQRNSKRFPTEFRFQISESDFNSLKSQIVTSKGGNRKLPWAYTEHGIAMMATLLRNDIAIAMSIEIIKAFITTNHYVINSPNQSFRSITA